MAIDNFVTAELRYFTPPADGSKPWTNIDADETTGERKRNFIQKDIAMQIENIRGKEDQYSLDKSGFQAFKAPSKIQDDDYSNEDKVVNEYYPEQIALLKELTGASRVVIFDHTIRRTQPGVKKDTPTNRHPVSNVHVDQTSTSARARVERHLPASDAPKLLEKRFQIINIWRPIRNPAFDWPLALCDYASVDGARDLVKTDLVYTTREPGEISSVKWDEGHKWKYVKGMTPDEGFLIKCYDSVEDGSVAVFTPHTAFVDPSAPEDAKLRESIELRALVFYD